VSGEIYAGVAIILAIVEIGDIFLIYAPLKGDGQGPVGGRYENIL
jgi:hypothetical protein